jgi:hypothetical protein
MMNQGLHEDQRTIWPQMLYAMLIVHVAIDAGLGSRLEGLPDELLGNILSRLNIQDWTCAASSCKRLNLVQPEALHLVLNVQQQLPFVVQRWKKASTISVSVPMLKFRDEELLSTLMRGSQHMGHLKELQLEVDTDDMNPLAIWLVYLLSRADQGLEALYLDVPDTVPLPMLANLKHLQLRWCGPLAASDSSMLGALTRLETLSLGNWQDFNSPRLPVHDAGRLDLRNATGLTSLSLWHLWPVRLHMPPACQLSMACNVPFFSPDLGSSACLQFKQLSVNVTDHRESFASARVIRSCAHSIEHIKVAFAGEAVLTREVNQAIAACENLNSLVLSAERQLSISLSHMPELQTLYLSSDGHLTSECLPAELGLTLEWMQLRYRSCSGASIHQLMQVFTDQCMEYEAVQLRQPGVPRSYTMLTAGCGLDEDLASWCYCNACHTCLTARGILVVDAR